MTDTFLDDQRKLMNEGDKQLMEEVKKHIQDKFVIVVIEELFRRIRETNNSINRIEKFLQGIHEVL
jgi:DNA-binding HxlR family transcriptional regulator